MACRKEHIFKCPGSTHIHISNIFDIINRAEEKLLEQKDAGLHTRTAVSQETWYDKHKTKSYKKCRLHGICKHTTDQCRALNYEYKKNHNNQKSKSQNLGFKNNQTKPKILQIPVEINGNPYKAVIDSGSTYNYINSAIVQKKTT
ncbi:hypothetical protein DMUE_1844 [Dictyocoela muelleri]|nr:hypothetical protein DMUE_1844 [Dictyocoela muelleri]